jgi:selenocysteine-specific elongation factor
LSAAIPYILATAGHIDHGKSALVRALSGVDPDRLPEEKRRGITIDLGFAFVTLKSPPEVAPAVEYQVGIVDVPGHEDFVKNMVAGVGSIDAALLVVAADDGWMPQTEEHLQILAYQGVRRGIVALSKADLITDPGAAMEKIRRRLAGSPLADAPIVPTSVVNESGIDLLRQSLARLFSRTPPQQDIGKPRLAVDRVFSLKGIGTVVTGTLSGGMLLHGQTVALQPAGTSARIRTLQIHGRDVDAAPPGARVALNLPDMEVSRNGSGIRGPRSICRGDVVTVAGVGSACKTVDVMLERSGRSFGEESQSAPPRPFKSGLIVHVHHGSSAARARVFFYDRGALFAGGFALARLELDAPLLAFAGDRFVVRDWSQQSTLAGGIVLDPQPAPGGRRAALREPTRSENLARRAASPGDAAVLVLTQLALDVVADRNHLLVKSRLPSDQIDGAVTSLVSSGALVSVNDLLFDAAAWHDLPRTAAGLVDEHHRVHPEQAGLSLPDLRRRMETEPLLRSRPNFRASIFDAAIEALQSGEFVVRGGSIRRAGHFPRLPARLQPAGERLRAALAKHALDPPSRKELARDDLSNQALRFLCASGEAIEVSRDLVISADACAKAATAIREYLQSHGSATVSDLKTHLSSSRRVMVPLLEYMDGAGVTRRMGDRRVLAGQPAAKLM